MINTNKHIVKENLEINEAQQLIYHMPISGYLKGICKTDTLVDIKRVQKHMPHLDVRQHTIEYITNQLNKQHMDFTNNDIEQIRIESSIITLFLSLCVLSRG